MPEPFALEDLKLPPGHDLGGLAAVCPDIALLRFRDAEFIVNAAENSRDAYLLVRGSALVSDPGSAERGGEMAVIEAAPDAPIFVGEMAALENENRSASVKSALNTWAFRLSPAHLDVIIEEFPGLTRILCRTMSRRLREANAQLRSVRAQTALRAAPRFLEAGECLFRKGDPADTLWQVVEGRIRCEGGERRLEVGPSPARPFFVDAAPYFRGGAYSCSAYAANSAVVVGIGLNARLAVLRNYPHIALELLEE